MNVVPFQTGSQITDFFFRVISILAKIWKQTNKQTKTKQTNKQKTLSQRDFPMKFSAKLENMNRFTFTNYSSFRMAAKTFFFILRNDADLC